MPRSILHKAATATAILLSAFVVGCSCEVQAGKISETEKADPKNIENAIGFQLEQQSGVPPQSLDCPDEMVNEEGKRYECTDVHPTDGEQIIDVTMHDNGTFKWLVR
jgi:hypothetical protein